MGVQANTKIRLPSGFNRLLASINSCRLMRPPENPKLYTLHPGRYVSKISGDSPLYVRESPSSRTSCTLFPHTLFRQKSSITASCLSRSVSGLTRQIATQHSNHPTDCMLRSFRQKFTTTPTIALVLSSSYPRASTTARSFLLSCSRNLHPSNPPAYRLRSPKFLQHLPHPSTRVKFCQLTYPLQPLTPVQR